MKLRERESIPLGKSDNPRNIFTWTNVQASFNPSNHIKHTPQGPWVLFHIKRTYTLLLRFYTRWTFDEFCQFSSLSTNLVQSAPFIAQLVQSASALSVRFKIHGPPFCIRLLSNLVPYSLSARATVKKGQREKGSRHELLQHSMSNMSSRRVGEESSKLMNELCHHRLPTVISSNSSSALALGYQFGVCAFSGQAAPGHVILFICRLFLVIICYWFWVAGFNVRTGLQEVTCTTAASVTNVTCQLTLLYTDMDSALLLPLLSALRRNNNAPILC